MTPYRNIMLLVTLVAILGGSRPVAAQSSGVLASAERAVAEALGEQEARAGSVIRTPRSTRMARIGVAVLAAGGAMVLIPQSEIWEFAGQRLEYTEKGYLTYAGLGAMAAGGVLIWRGLGMVEVPFRVDVTAGSGVRASRQFSW